MGICLLLGVPKISWFFSVGTLLLTESYFSEITQSIGRCKQQRFLGHGSCLVFAISLPYYGTSLESGVKF